MIKIGELANIFNISIKTIRFYEEKGLIKPYYTDIYTGYRYYDENNIKELSKILALKDLGLELSEIKNFDETKIESKIKEYEDKISKIEDNINILKSLSNKERRLDDMKKFINDDKAIGKWTLFGVYNNKEDYPNNKIDHELGIKELYLMPNGQNYWVISWTKDIIYINGRENKYEIENDLMYVYIKDIFNENEYVVAVFNKEDSKEYTIEEITIKDNINVPFEEDRKAVGFWKTVDIIQNINSFDPNNRQYKDDFYLKNISFKPNNELIVEYQDIIKKTKYTKNNIINLCMNDTLSKYSHLNINNKEYIIIEWKSGDYVYGKIINCYYVLQKID